MKNNNFKEKLNQFIKLFQNADDNKILFVYKLGKLEYNKANTIMLENPIIEVNYYVEM